MSGSDHSMRASQHPEGVERRQWLTLAVLSLALAIVIIDATIVNTAIPSIRREFAASLRDVEWSALYSLVFGAFMLTWGRFSDAFGRRRIFRAESRMRDVGVVTN